MCVCVWVCHYTFWVRSPLTCLPPSPPWPPRATKARPLRASTLGPHGRPRKTPAEPRRTPGADLPSSDTLPSPPRSRIFCCGVSKIRRLRHQGTDDPPPARRSGETRFASPGPRRADTGLAAKPSWSTMACGDGGRGGDTTRRHPRAPRFSPRDAPAGTTVDTVSETYRGPTHSRMPRGEAGLSKLMLLTRAPKAGRPRRLRRKGSLFFFRWSRPRSCPRRRSGGAASGGAPPRLTSGAWPPGSARARLGSYGKGRR